MFIECEGNTEDTVSVAVILYYRWQCLVYDALCIIHSQPSTLVIILAAVFLNATSKPLQGTQMEIPLCVVSPNNMIDFIVSFFYREQEDALCQLFKRRACHTHAFKQPTRCQMHDLCYYGRALHVHSGG